ncbi:MAG: Crp/Fnr family transcriptional regulator [Granulosicoccaceae bacterium]
MQRVTATTLATFDIFRGLSIQDRNYIAASMMLREYKHNELLISASDDRSEVFFLLSGTVRAHANSKAGKQVQYEDLSSGMMFGELSAIDDKPRGNDCIAVENATVAVMTSEVFYQVMQEYPTVMKAVLQRLAKLARKHIQRVYEFSTESVGTRVQLEIIRMIEDGSGFKKGASIQFDKVPTHADIASRISTHREAVTRELKRLERIGLIDWKPGRYAVHDITEFKSFSLSHPA